MNCLKKYFLNSLCASFRNFSLHHHIQAGSWAHPSPYFMGARAFSTGMRHPEYKADTDLRLLLRLKMH
jgi:hypothetical protein